MNIDLDLGHVLLLLYIFGWAVWTDRRNRIRPGDYLTSLSSWVEVYDNPGIDGPGQIIQVAADAWVSIVAVKRHPHKPWLQVTFTDSEGRMHVKKWVCWSSYSGSGNYRFIRELKRTTLLSRL